MMDVAAPNEWTQQIDEGMLNSNMSPGGILTAPSPSMAATAAGGGAAASGLSSTAAARAAMERPGGQDGAGQALRCPRCDSSNTKFCYYNNYSLSQPRHFCKACKRYWTRGGTLRNVPVGGGCRKNKRLKKPATTNSTATSTTSSSSTDPSMPSLPFLSNPSASMAGSSASPDLGLLLYTFANPASDASVPMPCNPYDFHHQLGALGQSFLSNTGEDYLPSLIKTTQLAQTAPAAVTTSMPPSLQDSSLFGSAASSLLASTLKQQQQQQQQHKALVYNPDLPPYGGLHAPACGGDMPLLREVKLEADANGAMMSSSHRNVLEWQFPQSDQHALETMAAESSLYWNVGAPAFGGGAWPDAASCGPSIAPLI